MKKEIVNPGATYQNGQMVRQGDVLMIKKDGAPPSVDATDPRPVLAEGELTGHAHELDEHTALIEGNDAKVVKDTAIRHEDHGGIAIDIGTWERRGQQQYVRGQVMRVGD